MEDVCGAFDASTSTQLLKLVQCVVLPHVDCSHIVDVPEYFLDEICPPVFWYDV